MVQVRSTPVAVAAAQPSAVADASHTDLASAPSSAVAGDETPVADYEAAVADDAAVNEGFGMFEGASVCIDEDEPPGPARYIDSKSHRF